MIATRKTFHRKTIPEMAKSTIPSSTDKRSKERTMLVSEVLGDDPKDVRKKYGLGCKKASLSLSRAVLA